MYRVTRVRANPDPAGSDIEVEGWRGRSRATANVEFAKSVAKCKPAEAVQLLQLEPKASPKTKDKTWLVLATYDGRPSAKGGGLRHDMRPGIAAREKFLQERRSRFTDREWAHAKKGLCSWQINDNPHGDEGLCPKRAPPDNLYCREHQRDARELYGATGR
jgi:hypothetical protein